MKDAAGHPTGELGEMAAQYMAYRVTDVRRFDGINANDLWAFARTATNVGVTTATDLHARVQDNNVNDYLAVTQNAKFSASPGTGCCRFDAVDRRRAWACRRPQTSQ
ncbi:MAG: hypothetical protein CM1200mP41_16470 [Gammaproteobacteria bacterium]|nr:MAG: hypothetical protein CM1200mP41_16470 [Gammaproteobacteria bacterium]